VAVLVVTTVDVVSVGVATDAVVLVGVTIVVVSAPLAPCTVSVPVAAIGAVDEAPVVVVATGGADDVVAAVDVSVALAFSFSLRLQAATSNTAARSTAIRMNQVLRRCAIQNARRARP
jgi:hypothetical protein